mgnify:CR=1 FL=1
MSRAVACRGNVEGCIRPGASGEWRRDLASWSRFDVSTSYPGVRGWVSSLFDGRYLYFTPNNNGAEDGIVTSYDTQAGFGSSGAWAWPRGGAMSIWWPRGRITGSCAARAAPAPVSSVPTSTRVRQNRIIDDLPANVPGAR